MARRPIQVLLSGALALLALALNPARALDVPVRGEEAVEAGAFMRIIFPEADTGIEATGSIYFYEIKGLMEASGEPVARGGLGATLLKSYSSRSSIKAAALSRRDGTIIGSNRYKYLDGDNCSQYCVCLNGKDSCFDTIWDDWDSSKNDILGRGTHRNRKLV